MYNPTTIFHQLLDLLPKNEFDQFVGTHKADRYVKKFTTWQQLIALLYAQATEKDSLREIETGLRVHASSWYHLGIENITKSTLARANAKRSYQIFESLFYALLKRCKHLLPDTNCFDFKNDLYALDSTTIDLCLNLFPWATFRTRKGGFKLHTLFNTRSQIPELIIASEANVHDLKQAKEMNISLSRDSFLVMDRAYIDYSWLYKLHKEHTFFVVRSKKNMQHVVVGQHPSSQEPGVIKDEMMELVLPDAEHDYPEPLRKVTFYDEETKKTYTFLTDNLELSAGTISSIYKARWQIELFFKWIKQHLKIKTFLGTSKNAVMTQIWVAMIYYLLLNYLKYQTKFKKSLLELTRIIKEVLLDHVSLIDILSLDFRSIRKTKDLFDSQLAFF